MANTTVFSTQNRAARTDTHNNAGGSAYAFGPKHALAQLAVTGCFNNTYYVSGESQVDKILELAKQVEPEFVAKLAIYSRKQGLMKDMPALLTAYLSTVSPELLWDTFPSVIDNGKMLRNFVQIMRSGVVGRKSLGTSPRRLVRTWFETRTESQILRNSVGNKPTLGDVIKMIHPKPASKERAALYAYFIGKEFNEKDLPEELQAYLTFKKDTNAWEGELPGVPFELLTGETLTASQWKLLAEQATWNQVRQALNTFHRHGVFTDPAMVKSVADKIRNPELVRRAKAFPYQLMTAFININSEIPKEIGNALQDAMELATENIPVLDGAVYVFPDVSGSMSSPISGYGYGMGKKPMSQVRCIDIAALVAAAVLRTNPNAEVIPFEGDVKTIKLNPKDSVMTNAQKLAAIGGGSTACSAPLRLLNGRKAKIDTAIYISDNESWKDYQYSYGRRETSTASEWAKARDRNPEAKMVCIDITPSDTTQVSDREACLNVGGFSDTVFDVMGNFLKTTGQHWVEQIEAVTL